MIDLTITTNEFSTTVTNGNPDPQDLSEFPVVDIVGPRSVQVREGGREERRERGREGGREGGREKVREGGERVTFTMHTSVGWTAEQLQRSL